MHWRRRCFWLCYAVGMPIGHKAYYYCDCINEQAYNITKQRSYVVVKVGDQEKQTSVGIGEFSWPLSIVGVRQPYCQSIRAAASRLFSCMPGISRDAAAAVAVLVLLQRPTSEHTVTAPDAAAALAWCIVRVLLPYALSK
eukprot:GHUV01050113.1.p1 GENE.GHUV01050113.1~~GHUV01050113.1.p1  ORF type:complete len:140 (-),score=13.10 GHUV01050113.1:410-829(-)